MFAQQPGWHGLAIGALAIAHVAVGKRIAVKKSVAAKIVETPALITNNS